MTLPKVSVVLTAYNSMPFLSEALTGVLTQTFKDFEVIIVDDGSTDQTPQWVSQQEDSRIKFILQSNQGVSAARNAGITNSQGDYIAFLDGDDIWEPTKLEKQVNILDKNPTVGLVHSWMAVMTENGELTGRLLISKSKGDVWRKIIEKNMVTPSSTMVRRSCIDKVGLFDQDLTVSEDWDLWIRLAEHYDFEVIEEPLVRYRQHVNSKSKRYPEMLQDFRTIIERAFTSVPFELLHLRNRSYGHINLVLAWKCLQGIEKDYKKAIHFCNQALSHYPRMRFSREYIRLQLAILLMMWFGSKSYNQILKLFFDIRRRILSPT